MTRKPDPPQPERVAIPPEAGADLARRYRARQEAEAHLVDYLAGLVAGLGIDPDRVRGFDDTTNELLLTP